MGHNIGGASYFGRVATVLVAKTHCYRVLWPGYQIAETIAGTILRIRTTGCMHTWQSSYEIVGECSDKGGHRYQPLDRFILQEVLARRRVMFMLRVMTYVVSYKMFWNWIGVVRFQGVFHEVCSDKGSVIWYFLYFFFTNSVVGITYFLNSNHFHYQ